MKDAKVGAADAALEVIHAGIVRGEKALLKVVCSLFWLRSEASFIELAKRAAR